MTVVRGWWNGQDDPVRRQQVVIHERSGQWRVDHLGPREAYEYVACAGPAQARAEADRFLSRGTGWRPLPR